jgi:hypothetical protein
MGTPEPPIGDGYLFDQYFLQRALRIELIFQIQQNGIKLLLAFRAFAGVNEDLFGQQAVLEGVAGGDGLAGWCDRSGRVGGILSIGGDLLVRGLRALPILTNGFVLEKSLILIDDRSFRPAFGHWHAALTRQSPGRRSVSPTTFQVIRVRPVRSD